MVIFGKLIQNDSLAQILYLVHSFLVSLVQSCLLPATARNKKLNIKNSMSSGHRKLTRTENAFSVLKHVLEKILSESFVRNFFTLIASLLRNTGPYDRKMFIIRGQNMAIG